MTWEDTKYDNVLYIFTAVFTEAVNNKNMTHLDVCTLNYLDYFQGPEGSQRGEGGGGDSHADMTGMLVQILKNNP